MVKSTNNACRGKYERKMRKGVRVKRRNREKGKQEAHTHKDQKPCDTNHNQM